jgi:hypothetical protein
LIKKEYKTLKKKYEVKLEKSISDLKKFLEEHKNDKDNLIKRAINLHSL